MIDTVAKTYDGVYYGISVNTDSLEIPISFVCGYVTIDFIEKPNLLYETITASKGVTFSQGKGEDNYSFHFL